jgi:hypothetical protein
VPRGCCDEPPRLRPRCGRRRSIGCPFARAFLGLTRAPGRESLSASNISDLVRADSDQIDRSLRANGSGPMTGSAKQFRGWRTEQ